VRSRSGCRTGRRPHRVDARAFACRSPPGSADLGAVEDDGTRAAVAGLAADLGAGERNARAVCRRAGRTAAPRPWSAPHSA
jgi:hypothetical protein